MCLSASPSPHPDAGVAHAPGSAMDGRGARGRGVEALRRIPGAVVEVARAQIRLGVRAVDGAAELPRPDRGLGPMVQRVRRRLGAHRRGGVTGRGEERAGFGDGPIGDGVAEAKPQQLERIPAPSGGAVGPKARVAGRGDAHPQRAARGAVDVAGEPVAALARPRRS